jgi:hypothetical protein
MPIPNGPKYRCNANNIGLNRPFAGLSWLAS